MRTNTFKELMELKFTSPFEAMPGIIARLLNESYAKLVKAEPEIWQHEEAHWKEADRSVFENPNTIGACTFMSWYGKNIVGFFSFDPRPSPAYGIIGHNCILPDYRNQGFGKQQMGEALRKLRQRMIRQAQVSTSDHPFFLPAQRMYVACGFIEVKRVPWDRDLRRNMIHYEQELDNQLMEQRLK